MDSMELVYDVGRLHRLMTQFAGQDMGRIATLPLPARVSTHRELTSGSGP